MRILAQGEAGIVVELGDAIDPGLNARVRRLARELADRLRGRVLEVVPTYRSLLVVHDPLREPRPGLVRDIEGLARAVGEAPADDLERVVRIPVCYGGAHGPDLEAVAAHAGLPPAEVVSLHAAPVYRVYMLGFLPGFPYLGGLDRRIACPRLDSPRTRIPPGSVGIGGEQTGIYPVESPGGWRLLGRTPLRLFDPAAQRPFLLGAGDGIRFVPIDEAAFAELSGKAAAGGLAPETEGAGR